MPRLPVREDDPMMTGYQVGGRPFDLQGGAGPSPARRKIAEEGQEPAAARELRVEKIGRRLHR